MIELKKSQRYSRFGRILDNAAYFLSTLISSCQDISFVYGKAGIYSDEIWKHFLH